MKNIRTAIIGAGYRGRYLITLLQKINLFDIIAVSDISPNLSEIISQLFAGEKIPKIYNSGTDDYRRMLNENTIDLVIIASPWHLHKEQTIEALKSGCHVAIEVKGALDEPVLTEEARRAGFTNEGGVGGHIRFLQNITGLWILQCLVRQWETRGWRAGYDFLIAEAEQAEDVSSIDVDAPDFKHPADMEKAIADYCRARGTKVPVTQGEYVRCVLQSLAERYRMGIQQMNALLPRPVECLHVIGGGCRNRLLNRLTEEATGIPVLPGPVEATAIGNLLVQAEACGRIKNKNEIQIII